MQTAMKITSIPGLLAQPANATRGEMCLQYQLLQSKVIFPLSHSQLSLPLHPLLLFWLQLDLLFPPASVLMPTPQTCIRHISGLCRSCVLVYAEAERLSAPVPPLSKSHLACGCAHKGSWIG